MGVNPETLRAWVSQAEIDSGDLPGTTTAEAQWIAELERENREQRRATEILRTASAFFAATELDRKTKVSTAAPVGYIDQRRDRFGIERICKVLRQAGVQVAWSSHYAAKARPPSTSAVTDADRLGLIRAVHAANYGV